jgi:hypothetical protein
MTLLLRVPELPDRLTAKVPVVAVLAAVNVTRLVLVAGFVSNVAVTPLGKPDAVKFTLPLNPFTGLIVMVLIPEPPCRNDSVETDADNVKLGCGADAGQLFTRFAAFTVPIPVAKSQPTLLAYAGANDVSEVESTPTVPSAR